MKKELTFNEQCYELIRLIPKGKVTTYKEIAKALNVKAYRAVGNAMAKNPNLVQLPCHRVVKSNGEIGGYAQGVAQKESLLAKEGVRVEKGKIIGFEKLLFSF